MVSAAWILLCHCALLGTILPCRPKVSGSKLQVSHQVFLGLPVSFSLYLAPLVSQHLTWAFIGFHCTWPNHRKCIFIIINRSCSNILLNVFISYLIRSSNPPHQSRRMYLGNSHTLLMWIFHCPTFRATECHWSNSCPIKPTLYIQLNSTLMFLWMVKSWRAHIPSVTCMSHLMAKAAFLVT